MKLKTLKDLEKEHEGFTYEDRLVTGDEIKEEAVKWIKHYREINKKDKRIADDDRDVRGVKFGANYLVQGWIKHFFNITEEDLK